MEIHKNLFNVKERFNILVIGAEKGAGTTTLASCLALSLGKFKGGVSYVEGENPQNQQGLAMWELSLDSHFHPLFFRDYFREDTFAAGENLYKGVNWILHGQAQGEIYFGNMDFDKISGNIIIVDNPDIENIAMLVWDVVLIVVDPMPSKVKGSLQEVSRIKKKINALALKPQVFWICNKHTRHLDIRKIEKFLDIKFNYFLDLFDGELSYRAAYERLPLASLLERNKSHEAKKETSHRTKAYYYMEKVEEIAARIISLME